MIIVKSIEYNKTTPFENLNLEYVFMINDDVKILSQRVIARVYRFVEYRVPRKQPKLYPGVHRVWDSFKYILPKICSVIILSGHTVESKELLLRS